jgi:hypothetical protein
MAMSDCDNCWETPCVCRDAHGYRHLSTNEITRIRDGLNDIIEKRTALGVDPTKRNFSDT